jgi:hypothetical protein
MSNWDNRAGVWFCSFGWIIVSDSAYTSPKSRSPARRRKVELSLAEAEEVVSHFPPNSSLTLCPQGSIGANITANSISAANDLTSLCPKVSSSSSLGEIAQR